MKLLHYILIFFSLVQLLFVFNVKGQNRPVSDSSTYLLRNIEVSDTTVRQLPDEYKTLKNKMNRKWSSKLYGVLIREPVVANGLSQPEAIDEEYRPYGGKIIRDINVIILKPFGTSVYDPDSVNTKSWFNNNANDLHVSTKTFIVRNNLQFHKGEPVKPMVIAETEALLRETSYISDARIHIVPVPLTNMVDVVVIVRDVWSIGLSIHKLSLLAADVEVFDKNVLGQGARFDFNIIYNKNYQKHWGFAVGYSYDNLFRTFINAGVSYRDNINYKNYSIVLERPLQTTLNYFGRAYYNQTDYRTNINMWDTITPDRNKDFSISLGRAFTLRDSHYTKRFVIAGGYSQRNPEYRDYVFPSDKLTPYQFSKNRLFLTQFSLYRQAYFREYLINNFGITENIAYGYRFSVQLGYNFFPDYKNGMYSSFSVSSGKRFRSGNYYIEGAVSSFFNSKNAYGGVFKINTRYFSPLMRIGGHRFRQFVEVDYAKLLNPIPEYDNILYYSQVSTLNTRYTNDYYRGTERLMINLESDFFSKVELLGFRFLFYTFGDLGWITSRTDLFKDRNFLGGMGFGIRVRNDLFVFKTLDIRIGWYPKTLQNSFNNYSDIILSNPSVSPNFVPTYPQEIPLD